MSDIYHLVTSLQSLNYFHFFFQWLLFGVSGHLGLEIKILYCCPLYSPLNTNVHKSTTICRGYMHMTMYARYMKLSSVIGHAKKSRFASLKACNLKVCM